MSPIMLGLFANMAIPPIAISLVAFSCVWLVVANLPHRSEAQRRSGTRTAVTMFVVACLLFVIPSFVYTGMPGL
ncbi:dolichyl-phosphate-mannose--protein O-mannosyl transferase [Planotetraspora sp. GP83]